ncbi:hypothetical protein KDX16_16110 [Burkholderia vietnamiensis]|jgi:hypothetical protein|uniref:Conjugal transfer protein TrbB n=1 Tax=Burkholderia aenigmatica TaxID=2015348 RepID=A0A6P2SZ53_9BURK|nr:MULTISPECIES: hypothetical protein [Burkholderia cepacia complex]HDR9763279.1 hypothetical protein [Burkholderia cepacia ATCC 25416]MBR7917349.1 hypothetical protein [Burkholderia vietnamiensis]MBR8055254.1 hypothetical protein [Burkholderia vietnamiensis]VWC53631.1 conjugal transfer protein TrbB [Burkholderia aenigmatica]HDR9795555.1 hypothetical protein [Burkholderia cepacia ATCC 25416]
MPSAFLSRNSFNQLKRAARQQLPGVQHAHVLEALARALGQNNLAALNAKLAVGEDNAVRFFLFSDHDLRIRLAELGYPDALTWDIDFSSLTDIFRVPKPFPTTLDALQADGTISFEQRRHFEQLIDQRKSILIIGTVGSRKTTLMHVLLNEMSVRAPREEFVLCQFVQEGPEFGPNVKRFVHNEFWPGGFPAFGHRRVAFDEIRDNTALRVLNSWLYYGAGLATMYASSVDEALARMTRVLGGPGVELIREAVDVVIRMERGEMPKVAEIVTRDELQKRSEPPEFQQELRQPANYRMPPPEDVGRYVLQDLKTLMGGRFSSGEQLPLDQNMPITNDDLRMPDAQPHQDGLAFTPKHWSQTADGSWEPSPASIFGTSHQALHGRQNDVLTQERMDEMSRIIAEGGRVVFFDPKVDTDVGRVLSGTSGSTTKTHQNRPVSPPDSDTTSDVKSD